MHTRVVSFTGAKDIDAGVAFFRDKVLSMLQQQDGYRGSTASADRHDGVFAVLTLWESEAARDASDGALLAVREEAVGIVGGDVTVETFEEFVAEIGERPPAPGSSLMVTRISMAPEAIDDNVAYFRSEVLPRITSSAGFRAVRGMIDRSTGRGIVGSAWDDAEAMQRAAEDAKSRRQEAVARGVTFDDVSFREILAVDLK